MTNQTLLLDIDGVLLPWNGDRFSTGFSDWTSVKQRHFSHVSREQLDLIALVFPDIQWHTTWISGDTVNLHFTPNTNFGPYSTLIDRLSDHFSDDWQSLYISPHGPDEKRVPNELIKSSTVHRALKYARWWKLNAVAALLATDRLPGKVVWADDDLIVSHGAVRAVLEEYDATDRFRLISPDVAWTRESIIAAAEWLAD